MLLLLLYLYGAWLGVSLVAGWGLRHGRIPASLRTLILVTPLLLIGGFFLRPEGHSLWGKLPEPLLRPWLGYLTLGCWVVAVPARGVRKLLALTRDRALSIQMGRRLRRFEEAPEVGFQRALQVLGITREVPILGLSGITGPAVLGAWREVILFPVEWIPASWREDFPGWAKVGEAELKSMATLRSSLFHEVAHLRHRDALRRWIRVFTCLVLPWEWVSLQGRPRPSLLRAFFEQDQTHQEQLAGDLAHAMDGRMPPVTAPKSRKAIPASALTGATLILALYLAPGREALQLALGGEKAVPGITPPGWNVVPGSLSFLNTQGKPRRSSLGVQEAFLPPAKGRLPRIRVVMPADLPEVNRTSVPPGLYANMPPMSLHLPPKTILELVWDIEYRGPGQLYGLEANVDVRQAWEYHENSFILASGDVRESARQPLEKIGPSKYRYVRWVHVPSEPNRQPESGGIGFHFRVKGTYTFDPPNLTLILPDGTRIPWETWNASLRVSIP